MIEKKDLEYVASLSKLKLREEDVEKVREKFSMVLDYVSMLNKLDIQEVEPLINVNGMSNVMREDVVYYEQTKHFPSEGINQRPQQSQGIPVCTPMDYRIFML